jgi:response regulator RpfG family c-di-GMP phosphodiesterase
VLEPLLRAQVLSRAQVDHVISLLSSSAERAEDVIVESEVLSEAALLKALSALYQTHFVSIEKLSKADIPKATVQMIPHRVAETLGVFPVVFDPKGNALSVVTPDPDNAEMLREVKLVSGASTIKAFVALPAAIAAAIRKHHVGDPRAFERFERVGLHTYGQQVLADGRVVRNKDSFRKNLGSDEDLQLDRVSPTPALPSQPQAGRRAPMPSSTDEAQFSRPPRPSSPELAPSPGPPPLPKKAPAKRPAESAPSLSVPPPPVMAQAPAPAPAPAKAPAPDSIPAGRSSSSSLPRAQDPSQPSSRLASTRPSDVAAPLHAFQNDTTIELLTVLVSLLENARQELRGHSSQVSRLLRRVAERMNLDRADTYAVIVAGHIHDLGKMGQFHLTSFNCGEYEGHRAAAMKGHDTPLRLLESVRLPPAVKNAVFHMYERVDGKGFPDKLVGKEIPLGARLLAVADTYADLTQNPRNPFRKVLAPAEAMEVLTKHQGTIFDSSILDLFKALVLDEDMKAKLLANRHNALIIDQDPEESTVLELRMVEQGFDVKIARSIDAARKLLAAESADFDLVVSEVELPDADGLAFLSEARKESWGRDIAWVVYTHKQGRSEAQRAFDLGAMDFVAKPSQADVLVAKIKAMLEQRSQNGKGGAAKGVSGSLREMGLPDIVQVLFHGRKTGKLALKSGDGAAGEIHFLEGAVANAIMGKLEGAAAFYAMVRIADGEFALDPTFVPPKRVVAESAEALLLEGMRRMDEGL